MLLSGEGLGRRKVVFLYSVGGSIRGLLHG